MTVVPDVVGIMLPGAPSDGDPRGARDFHKRGGVLNLTEVVGVRLTARRIGGILRVRACVLTDVGEWFGDFPEDQSKAAPYTWFTRPTLDIP